MIDEVEAWCQQHLGARPWGAPLFTESNTSEVIGLRLDDGRAVVVKVRRCSEAVIVGVTAAVFASSPRNLASTPEQAIAFINAYEAASGVPMGAATRPAAFAALLWERAFAAARAHATAPDEADTAARVDRLQGESEIWLELAGA